MRKAWYLLLFVFVLAAGPVLAQADEVIHFTNGTTMPIRAHSVADGMIHIDLGTNSYMAFPISMVEKVTKAGKPIELVHSTALRNKMAEAHRANADAIAQRAESTSTEPEVLTREEKLQRYTDRVRNGTLASNVNQPYVRSTSANGVRTADVDGEVPFRSHSLGEEPNLSGKRLGYVQPGGRKTVGGRVVDARTYPNKANVELVGKSRAVTSEVSGGSGN